MTDHARLQAQLEERLKELTERAYEIDEDLSELADADWDDNAIEAADDEVLERIGRATVEGIQSIRRALDAIQAGTYGTCAECGEKISVERLEALPEATRCTRCA